MKLQGLLAASLILCASSTVAAETDPHRAALIAPQLPPWPTGLSGPRVDAGVTCMDKDLADATNRRLEAAGALPERCQLRIDISERRCDHYIEDAVDVARGDCLIDGMIRDAGRGWPTWKVGALSGGVSVAATLVGIAVGALVF